MREMRSSCARVTVKPSNLPSNCPGSRSSKFLETSKSKIRSLPNVMLLIKMVCPRSIAYGGRSHFWNCFNSLGQGRGAGSHDHQHRIAAKAVKNRTNLFIVLPPIVLILLAEWASASTLSGWSHRSQIEANGKYRYVAPPIRPLLISPGYAT